MITELLSEEFLDALLYWTFVSLLVFCDICVISTVLKNCWKNWQKDWKVYMYTMFCTVIILLNVTAVLLLYSDWKEWH